MPGTVFSHPLIQQDLVLRLAPTEVNWAYNLVTSETATYAGQVVQVLSVNFENFNMVGQFGRESRDDYERRGDTWFRTSAPSTNTSSVYGPGLTQMTEWFKQYFSIASQGNDGTNYSQQPVTVTYAGSSNIGVGDMYKSDLTWQVYPTSFPSYKIANDNFAPEWRIECQVHEAPQSITDTVSDEAISRLTYAPLYQPGSIWSDAYSSGGIQTPAELRKAAQDALNATLTNVDHFFSLLPTYTESDILDLLQHGFSSPVNTNTQPSKAKANSIRKSGHPFDSNSLIPGFVQSPIDSSGIIGGSGRG